jgi:hypothetical protein
LEASEMTGTVSRTSIDISVEYKLGVSLHIYCFVRRTVFNKTDDVEIT